MNGDDGKWESYIQRHVNDAVVKEARVLLTESGVNDIQQEILNNVIAKEILLHMPGLPSVVQQDIQREYEKGKIKGMRELVNCALFIYDNAFHQFLIGLSKNKQTGLLKKLLKQIGVSATLSEPQVNPQPVNNHSNISHNYRMPVGDAASSAMSSVENSIIDFDGSSDECDLNSVYNSINSASRSIDKSIDSRPTSQSENLMNSNPSVNRTVQPDQQQVRTAPGSQDPYLQSLRSGDFQKDERSGN